MQCLAYYDPTCTHFQPDVWQYLYFSKRIRYCYTCVCLNLPRKASTAEAILGETISKCPFTTIDRKMQGSRFFPARNFWLIIIRYWVVNTKWVTCRQLSKAQLNNEWFQSKSASNSCNWNMKAQPIAFKMLKEWMKTRQSACLHKIRIAIKLNLETSHSR